MAARSFTADGLPSVHRFSWHLGGTFSLPITMLCLVGKFIHALKTPKLPASSHFSSWIIETDTHTHVALNSAAFWLENYTYAAIKPRKRENRKTSYIDCLKFFYKVWTWLVQYSHSGAHISLLVNPCSMKCKHFVAHFQHSRVKG